jgi:hypothetical protein
VVIEWAAFSFCDSLISVELPDWSWLVLFIHFIDQSESVIEIQQCAFASCDSLASLDLPEGLHSIGPESYSLYWTCIIFKWQIIGKHSYSVHSQIASLALVWFGDVRG